MFYLQRNPSAVSTIAAHREIIESTRRRLADSTLGVDFEPVGHRYSINGRDIPSVSSILDRYDPFDDEKTAAECSRNPRSKYFGMTPEDILLRWKEAADAGTAVHAFGEACYLWICGMEDEIEDPFRERITPDGLAAVSPKEEAVARWWAAQDWTRYVPVAKETMVYNPALNYAGTFDLLLYDTVEDVFLIRDYKTNEDLFKWYGKYLGGQFYKVIKKNDEGKYTVQQNLYAIQLRRIGLNVGGVSLVWLRDDRSWQEVGIRNLEKLVEAEISYSQNTQPRLFS